MVYLDYNATTPVDAEVLEEMLPFLEDGFGNPSSMHGAGRRVRAGIDRARERLADLLGVRPHEIIFTSGGTESCNLAILGLARARKSLGRHVISVETEHPAVLESVKFLRDQEGYEATLLPVDTAGHVSLDSLAEAIRPDTILVSIMSANNETGVIQPISEMGALCRERGIFFHTDAVQSFGKLPTRPGEMSVDALSLAAHKFHGPKGAGALWVRSGQDVVRMGHGGGHENSRRPGTENAAAIVGLAAAAELAERRREAEAERLVPLREALWEAILEVAPFARRNAAGGLCNTLNVGFPGCDGESLLMALDLEGICVSTGSACMVGSMQVSHVLLAMGIDPKTASASLRFSLGAGTTVADISRCRKALENTLSRQNNPSPNPTQSIYESEAIAV